MFKAFNCKLIKKMFQKRCKIEYVYMHWQIVLWEDYILMVALKYKQMLSVLVEVKVQFFRQFLCSAVKLW